jgi:hypothetical protein
MSQEQMQLNIPLEKTVTITDEEGNPIILTEGLILRKANKFLVGTAQDALVPIPVYYDLKTHKIALDMLPPEIRDEFKEVGFYFSK